MRRPEEAVKMFVKAARVEGVTSQDSVAKLYEIKELYKDRGDHSRAEWIKSILTRLPAG